MKRSDSIVNLAQALIKSQREMGAVTKASDNPYFKSKYADINDILDVVVPVLNNNGILVIQPTSLDPAGNPAVETTLIHVDSGEFMTSEPLTMVLAKSDMQQLGAAITYGRRFSLQSFLGLRAEDDDGNTATGKKLPPQQQQPKPTQPTPTQKQPEPPKQEAAKPPTTNVAPKKPEPPKQQEQAKPKPSFRKPSDVKKEAAPQKAKNDEEDWGEDA